MAACFSLYLLTCWMLALLGTDGCPSCSVPTLAEDSSNVQEERIVYVRLVFGADPKQVRVSSIP
jgi:hypothetical protein